MNPSKDPPFDEFKWSSWAMDFKVYRQKPIMGLVC
jgi:hypothetical protein